MKICGYPDSCRCGCPHWPDARAEQDAVMVQQGISPDVQEALRRSLNERADEEKARGVPAEPREVEGTFRYRVTPKELDWIDSYYDEMMKRKLEWPAFTVPKEEPPLDKAGDPFTAAGIKADVKQIMAEIEVTQEESREEINREAAPRVDELAPEVLERPGGEGARAAS